MWWARWFQVISVEKAEEWGLRQHRNLSDYEQILMNCKMMYIDKKGNQYRVEKYK